MLSHGDVDRRVLVLRIDDAHGIRHERLEEPAARKPCSLLLELAAHGAQFLAHLDAETNRIVPKHFA